MIDIYGNPPKHARFTCANCKKSVPVYGFFGFDGRRPCGLQGEHACSDQCQQAWNMKIMHQMRNDIRKLQSKIERQRMLLESSQKSIQIYIESGFDYPLRTHLSVLDAIL